MPLPLYLPPFSALRGRFRVQGLGEGVTQKGQACSGNTSRPARVMRCRGPPALACMRAPVKWRASSSYGWTSHRWRHLGNMPMPALSAVSSPSRSPSGTWPSPYLRHHRALSACNQGRGTRDVSSPSRSPSSTLPSPYLRQASTQCRLCHVLHLRQQNQSSDEHAGLSMHHNNRVTAPGCAHACSLVQYCIKGKHGGIHLPSTAMPR